MADVCDAADACHWAVVIESEDEAHGAVVEKLDHGDEGGVYGEPDNTIIHKFTLHGLDYN